MLNRSRTRKKRRRRAAYGRSLYKINNDTSTKFIEGCDNSNNSYSGAKSAYYRVKKSDISLFFFLRLAARCSCTRAKLTWQVCVRLGCISRLLVNDPHLPYILFDHSLLCASICNSCICESPLIHVCVQCASYDSNASLQDYHDLWLARLFPDCDAISMVAYPIPPDISCIGKSNSQPTAGAVVNGAFSAVNAWTLDSRWKSLDDRRHEIVVLRTLESSTGNTPVGKELSKP